MRDGVILDCGRHESGQGKKDDDDWWRDVYVTLSRATRIPDVLLIRASPWDFLLHGPPSSLQKALRQFAKRAEAGRKKAEGLIAELGFGEFLH